MAIEPPSPCETDNVIGDPFWDSPLGLDVVSLERSLMAPLIRRFHGDAVLWIGDHAESADTLQRCMVRNCVYLQQDQAGPHGEIPALAGTLEDLPFRSKSFDGVVLHHALERVADPRVALREVSRVLAPGGRVLICGFNPLSMMGARRLYGRWFSDCLSTQRLVNPLRLFDWLPLLGLELQGRPLYSGYGLPLAGFLRRGSLEHMRVQPGMLPFGALLLVDVVKQASTMKPQWRLSKQKRHLAPVAYPRVASWQRSKL